MYDSTRKFVQFQLTVNIVAVLIAFIGAVPNGESPLNCHLTYAFRLPCCLYYSMVPIIFLCLAYLPYLLTGLRKRTLFTLRYFSTNYLLIFTAWNVFSGILNNAIFHAVMLFTLVVQIVIVQFGGDFTQTRPLNSQPVAVLCTSGFSELTNWYADVLKISWLIIYM